MLVGPVPDFIFCFLASGSLYHQSEGSFARLAAGYADNRSIGYRRMAEDDFSRARGFFYPRRVGFSPRLAPGLPRKPAFVSPGRPRTAFFRSYGVEFTPAGIIHAFALAGIMTKPSWSLSPIIPLR